MRITRRTQPTESTRLILSPVSCLLSPISRSAFTLVEMMVATALTLFIMTILSAAFISGLEVFSKLKAIGDMEAKLRTVSSSLIEDLREARLEGTRKLSDNTVVTVTYAATLNGTVNVTGMSATDGLNIGMPVTGPGIAANTTISAIPSSTTITLSVAATGSGLTQLTFIFPPVLPTEGFFSIRQGAATTGELTDLDGIPGGRATTHSMNFTIRLKGIRREKFLQGALRQSKWTTYAVALPTGTFESTPYDEPTLFSSQAAEVGYELVATGQTPGGTPLHALYRSQFLIPQNPGFGNAAALITNPPTPAPVATNPGRQSNLWAFENICCVNDLNTTTTTPFPLAPASAQLLFSSATDLASATATRLLSIKPGTAAPTTGTFHLVVSDPTLPVPNTWVSGPVNWNANANQVEAALLAATNGVQTLKQKFEIVGPPLIPAVSCFQQGQALPAGTIVIQLRGGLATRPMAFITAVKPVLPTVPPNLNNGASAWVTPSTRAAFHADNPPPTRTWNSNTPTVPWGRETGASLTPRGASLLATDVVSFQVQILKPGATSFSDLDPPPTVGLPAAQAAIAQQFPRIFDTNAAFPFRIQALQITIRVWDRKTNNTRQVTVMQEM